MDRELIEKIADQIVRLLQGPPAQEAKADTLVVICDHVTRARDAATHLWERFGGRIWAGALQEGYEQPGFEVTQMTEQAMLLAASESENIVFLSPRSGLLKRMAMGLDGEYLENLFFRSLLRGKKVHIMLDYSPPSRLKRGTFFKSVSESLDTLAEMGIAVFTYSGEHVAEEGLSLVTETEVQDAYRQMNTRIVCSRGAIVTPAAWDRAKELNIQIEWQGR